MPLTSGQRVGAYKIISPLGAGGMGEVYRARDSKLKREVAIKVLPADVANDRERLARFQREAEVLASLNHPHIAHVYGIEENALVMELVEGEDLSQRIARGAIPIDEALPIAKQIAEALEAAHDAGIIHRDLKPANIKVREDGTVKVLDFGLAKALDRSEGDGFSRRHDAEDAKASSLRTITSPAMTMRGVILGTAAYMSPEQAKGKAVDKRADIWAFGCVLYEMLTGKRTFKGDDVTDIITSVMRDTPDWTALPAHTPLTIRTLLRRCLEKDPRKRAPHMAIARLEIDDAMMSTGELAGGPATAAPRRAAWPLALGIGAAMAAAASAITFLVTRPAVTVDAAPVLRYSIDVPLTGFSGVALSPNGRFVAVSGRAPNGLFEVWIRPLDGTEFTRVAETQSGNVPFWSPDSNDLGFFADRKLMRLRMPGGAGQEVADLSGMMGLVANVSATWGADGAILVGGPDGVYRVMSSGGAITKVVGDDSTDIASNLRGFLWPQWAPGQAGFFYTAFVSGVGDAGRLLFRSPAGTASTLTATRGRAAHTKQGLLVARMTSASSATLSAHRFDAATGTIDMPGTVLVADASLEFAASDTGVLIYRQNAGGIPFRFEWMDHTGRSTGEGFDALEAGPFNLSRDGTLLAYMENGAVMVRDMSRGVATRLVGRAGAEPILSPDGRRIAYSLPGDTPPRIVVQSSSGGAPETVFTNAVAVLAEDWSNDGKYLAANIPGRGLIIPLDTTQPPTTYAQLPTGAVLDESRFSPDGRWMLFNASDSGRHEVYLVPLPATGERWQLSLSGGSQGRWRRDGRAIYYMDANGDLMTLDITLADGQRPRIGAPRKLFATGLAPSPNIDQFAPNADGTRFILRRPRAGDVQERDQGDRQLAGVDHQMILTMNLVIS